MIFNRCFYEEVLTLIIGIWYDVIKVFDHLSFKLIMLKNYEALFSLYNLATETFTLTDCSNVKFIWWEILATDC